MGANVFGHFRTQRDVARLFAQVKDSSFDSVRRWQTLRSALDFPDTEEVTGSNPVRPTRHFLFLAYQVALCGPTTALPRALPAPGSALWLTTGSTVTADTCRISETAHARSSPRAGAAAYPGLL